MNPYNPPISASNGLDSASATPPKHVRFGINLIAFSVLLGFAKVAYQRIDKGLLQIGDTRSILTFGIGTLIMCAMVYFVLRSIYRGRKLALWIYLIFTLLTIISLTLIFRQWNAMPSTLDRITYIVQGVLQISAALLLVLPASWRWFYPKTRLGETAKLG